MARSFSFSTAPKWKFSNQLEIFQPVGSFPAGWNFPAPKQTDLETLQNSSQPQLTKMSNSTAAPQVLVRRCATHDHFHRQAEIDPSFADRNRVARVSRVATRTTQISVPVVVHVLFNDDTSNITKEQIESQIAVLNKDFSATNGDLSLVPTPFRALVGNANIEFRLARRDPNGQKTDGIVRSSTTQRFFRVELDDAMLQQNNKPWPREAFLNLWIVPDLRNSDGDQILGYAQFPGGPAGTDGVVIRHECFGTTGTAVAPFNLGRTATHEVGHWFNLRHIWGDDGQGCDGTDEVDDTPNQGGANFGNPVFPKTSCNNAPNGDMFMNYMDYVDDISMFMFTLGQVARIDAALANIRRGISAVRYASGFLNGEISGDKCGVICLRHAACSVKEATRADLERAFPGRDNWNTRVAVHRWVQSKGFSAGFLNGEQDDNRRGVVCLLGDAVAVKEATQAQLEDAFTGDWDTDVAAHRWAVAEGFVSGFRNGEQSGNGTSTKFGVVCIRHYAATAKDPTLAVLKQSFPTDLTVAAHLWAATQTATPLE
jgi:hypothetical protein